MKGKNYKGLESHTFISRKRPKTLPKLNSYYVSVSGNYACQHCYVYNLNLSHCHVDIWPSGKLPFECQKIEKIAKNCLF